MFRFNCPDPKVDTEIIIERPDSSLEILEWFEEYKIWCVGNPSDPGWSLSLEDQQFISGLYRWIYKSEAIRAIDLFSKKNIACEL